jgi:hypothetical protein
MLYIMPPPAHAFLPSLALLPRLLLLTMTFSSLPLNYQKKEEEGGGKRGDP